MAVSNTYAFNPSNADIILESFDRVQMRGVSITNEHMISARRSLNLELASWSNLGVSLWEVDLQEIALTAGTTSYELDPTTVIVLDVYVSQTPSGSTQPIDRILTSIGRTEYAMLPNKEQRGLPTVFWFDRTSPIPQIYIWQSVPTDGIYTLKYYRMKRIMDANPNMGQTAEIPFRFLDALCAGLAARLATKYAPELSANLKLEATQALTLAMVEDRERVPLYIQPDLGGYFQ